MAQNNGSHLRVREVRDYNPDTGATIVRTYTGTAAQISDVRTYWELLGEGAPVGYGYKTTTEQDATGIHLTVRIPDDILYTDRWGLETEVISFPIWWNEDIRTFLGYPTPTGTAAEQLAANQLFYRARGFILSAVSVYESGQADSALGAVINAALAAGVTWNDSFYQVCFLIMREGDSFQWKRPVLKRNRTIPVGSANRTNLVGPQNVYTTAQLISTFGVPADIVSQITTVDAGLPTAPPDTVWGWKMRRDSSDVQIGFGKYHECRDWVYDLWSIITHTIVS